jgi:N utilization substance protein B
VSRLLPRTRARKRALDLLYGADVLGRDIEDDAIDVPEFTRELVEGVTAHHAELDELIQRYAERWALERMPVVDRNLLRIGIYELLHRPDVPTGAAIDSAVELAKLLSTPDSARFVNGILGRVAREHPRA